MAMSLSLAKAAELDIFGHLVSALTWLQKRFAGLHSWEVTQTSRAPVRLFPRVK